MVHIIINSCSVITMKSEESEINYKPNRAGIVAKSMLLLSLVLTQAKFVAAWSFQSDVLQPMWDGLWDLILPIGGIVLVAVGMGKASTIDGIPQWTKWLLGFITVVVCLVLATGIGSVGSVDVGQGFQDMFGTINIFD